MKTFNLFVCIFFLLAAQSLTAQTDKKRLQPGTLYEAGEQLYAPQYGFITTVPQGWEGILPQESEVFLLTTTSTSTYGEIFVFASELNNPDAIKDAWLGGLDLNETMRIKAVSPIIEQGLLTSEIILEGDNVNKGNKGFAAARCSEGGICITTLMVAPIQFYESVSNTVVELMKNSSFETPSNTNRYAEFDWNDFLSNKVLTTYAFVSGGSKEAMVHLCGDGTFTAILKKKGFFKDKNPAYKGNLTGQWSAKEKGEASTIEFTFDKKGLSPLSLPIALENDRVMSSGERYFIGKSDKCK